MTPRKPARINARLTAWIYVAIQAILILAIVFIPTKKGNTAELALVMSLLLFVIGVAGVLVSALSIPSSLTAMPIPKERGRLSTNGLYRYVRHPMYSSVVLAMLGVAIYYESLYKLLIVICLGALFYFKSIYEEKYLLAKYAGYGRYKERVPRFIPRIF